PIQKLRNVDERPDGWRTGLAAVRNQSLRQRVTISERDYAQHRNLDADRITAFQRTRNRQWHKYKYPSSFRLLRRGPAWAGCICVPRLDRQSSAFSSCRILWRLSSLHLSLQTAAHTRTQFRGDCALRPRQ